MSAESWFTLAALAVIVAWVVATHNALQGRRRHIAEAFARLDAELSRRYELVPRLVDATLPVLGHSAATLQAVQQAQHAAVAAMAIVRARPMDPVAVGMLATAERALDEALERLRIVVQNHAQLDADGLTHALVEELAVLEARIDQAREAYNGEVIDYNDEASLFPAVLVARLCGFLPAATLLAQAPAHAAAPRVAY